MEKLYRTKMSREEIVTIFFTGILACVYSDSLPLPLPEEMCHLQCPYGFEHDFEGNQMCQCRDPCKSTFPCILGNLLATCKEKCLYGYERDVEGNEFCKCLDPCQYIYCNNNTACVVRMLNGRPQGVCERTSKIIQDPITTVTDTVKKLKGKRVCYQNLPLEAIKCTDNRTKRWYFDSNLRQCKHFRGCQTPGNNFSRKRHCKRQCLGKKRRRHGKRRQARRRWLRKKRLDAKLLTQWFIPKQDTMSESHSVSQR